MMDGINVSLQLDVDERGENESHKGAGGGHRARIVATASGLSEPLVDGGKIDAAPFVTRHVAREHRDARGLGCTLAALTGDAARRPAR